MNHMDKITPENHLITITHSDCDKVNPSPDKRDVLDQCSLVFGWFEMINLQTYSNNCLTNIRVYVYHMRKIEKLFGKYIRLYIYQVFFLLLSIFNFDKLTTRSVRKNRYHF